MTLVVSEIFGPTWQGEGPSAGRLAWFLRLGGCNLTCTWCDTPYTWDASRYDLRAELTRMGEGQVAHDLPGDVLVVITGGEPLLQSRGLAELLDLLHPRPVEIETNGTLEPPPWAALVDWNVSPKLEHSGRATKLAPGWLDTPTARYKFVVRDRGDLDKVAAYGTPPERTWVMPEGVHPVTVLSIARAVADETLARGWNLTMRQHVLLWAGKRGR